VGVHDLVGRYLGLHWQAVLQNGLENFYSFFKAGVRGRNTSLIVLNWPILPCCAILVQLKLYARPITLSLNFFKANYF